MKYIKTFEICSYSLDDVKIGDIVVCIKKPSDYTPLSVGKKYKVIDIEKLEKIKVEELIPNPFGDDKYLSKTYLSKIYFTSEYEWVANKYNL